MLHKMSDWLQNIFFSLRETKSAEGKIAVVKDQVLTMRLLLRFLFIDLPKTNEISDMSTVLRACCELFHIKSKYGVSVCNL